MKKAGEYHMAGKSYELKQSAGYVISEQAAERLLSSGDGDAALLYIFMLSHGGAAGIGAAAEVLRLPQARLELAAERLCSLGLASGGGEDAPLPNTQAEAAPKGPQPVSSVSRYTAAEMAQLINGDPKLRQLADEAEKLFGRVLSGSEYARLVGLYTELGLSPETILLGINHCFETNERRGKRTTMRDVERLGFKWAEMELFDVQSAEAQLQHQSELDERTERVREALQLGGRALSPTERKYITEWLELGYAEDALQEAYDRTVLKTGRLTWKYMDTIVRSWHEKGLISLSDIKAGDRSGAKNTGNGKAGGDESDIAWMRRFVEQGRKEGEH